jgi:DNA repair exonuclease SbcCD ATPase subunit
MGRLTALIALAALVWFPGQSSAQPSPEEIKKLEAQRDRLQAQVKELEAQLRKVKEAAGKKDERPSFTPFGRMDAQRLEELKKLAEQFKDGKWDSKDVDAIRKWAEQFRDSRSGGTDPSKMTRDQLEKAYKEALERLERRDGDRGGWGGWGRGWGGWRDSDRRPAEAEKGNELERRLDRLIKEMEELKRDIRRR